MSTRRLRDEAAPAHDGEGTPRATGMPAAWAALAVLGGLLVLAGLRGLGPLVWPSWPAWDALGLAAPGVACLAVVAACVAWQRARLLGQRLREEARRRDRAERDFLRSRERYLTLFDHVPVGLYRNEVAPVGRLTMANPAIVRMFGYASAEEFMEVDGDDFFVDPADRERWKEALLGQGKADMAELRLRRKDGTPFWAAITAKVVRNDDGQIECVDGIIQDVTRRKRAEQRLREANRRLITLATTDGLTGLLNRRTVLEHLRVEFERSRRLGRPLAVVLADVDHFKSINDTYGHQAGDVVLAQFAQHILSEGRPYDLAGRYGGEEFLIALPESDTAQARAVAERLRLRTADAPAALGADNGLQVTASFGVAEADPETDTTIETLIRRADEALYQAKEQGRNRVCAASDPVPTP